MDAGFWIGILRPVSLSILGNVWTPSVQDAMARCSSERAEERAKQVEAIRLRILGLAARPGLINRRLLVAALEAPLAAAFFGAVSGMLLALEFVFDVTYVTGQLIAVVGAVVTVNIVVRAS
ncbi:hypothetical protein [Georgenia wangjunii]|uniref:hypothetical protein n=1 Tax=Georgenia wangjunii TaxID=3117730 RepID=UPI002F268215